MQILQVLCSFNLAFSSSSEAGWEGPGAGVERGSETHVSDGGGEAGLEIDGGVGRDCGPVLVGTGGRGFSGWGVTKAST